MTQVTTESRRLRGKLELVLPVLLATSRRLISHPGLHGIYPEFLIMAHGIVRASVPLMETALTTARTLPNDQVAVLLADYLEHHIPEERGHDDWLLADLESIGVPPDQVLSRVPSPTIAALVGSQYYWVQHVHPVGLLGYIAMFECYPPARQDIDRVQAATGYGPEAFRTLPAARRPGYPTRSRSGRPSGLPAVNRAAADAHGAQCHEQRAADHPGTGGAARPILSTFRPAPSQPRNGRGPVKARSIRSIHDIDPDATGPTRLSAMTRD